MGVTFFYMNAEIAFQQRCGLDIGMGVGWDGFALGLEYIHTYSTIQARMIDMNEIFLGRRGGGGWYYYCSPMWWTCSSFCPLLASIAVQ